MTALKAFRLGVAGSGVLGLCAAIRAADAGARVEVFDAAPLGGNASRVAAGMIAPLGEALFEDGEEAALSWRLAARDRWSDMISRASQLQVSRGGAVFYFDSQVGLETAIDRIDRWDVPAKRGPNLSLKTFEDWCVDPPAALMALSNALVAAGGRLIRRSLQPEEVTRFDAVILAAGYDSRQFAGLAPELADLQPIKGHILSFPGQSMDQAITRTSDVYLVAQAGRLLAGATMQFGSDDLLIEPRQVQALHRRVLALRPDLSSAPFGSAAGVRASTSDGLPMVGPSSAPGLFLATGARRNGWLYAPLVAEILLSYLSGDTGGGLAKMMDPARFLTRPSR